MLQELQQKTTSGKEKQTRREEGPLRPCLQQSKIITDESNNQMKEEKTKTKKELASKEQATLDTARTEQDLIQKKKPVVDKDLEKQKPSSSANPEQKKKKTGCCSTTRCCICLLIILWVLVGGGLVYGYLQYAAQNEELAELKQRYNSSNTAVDDQQTTQPEIDNTDESQLD